MYLFGCKKNGTTNLTPEEVGGKAANLARMTHFGLPVPPGFVLTTDLCRRFYHDGRRLPDDFLPTLTRGIQSLEQETGLGFGSQRRALLVSVRSGAAVSMPGMLDTILNVGLCHRTISALIRMTGNPRMVWDSYRRLVQTYAEVVHRIPAAPFERALQEAIDRQSVPDASELDVAALRAVTQDFLDIFAQRTGRPFPQDPQDQLAAASQAVLRSWENRRAVEYRRLHGLDHLAGTAVTIQTMVFGNMGTTSGSGVAFTRDPTSGEDVLYLDFVWNAQGEDLVSGRCPVHDSTELQTRMPDVYRELRRTGRQLEQLFRDVQDFEFTVQDGRLYLLQSRHAKRTAWAALRIATDLVREGLIDEATALARLAPYDLASIRRVRLQSAAGHPPLATGTAASPGVAVGPIALDAQAATSMSAKNQSPILVRTDISPDDLAGIVAAGGILTARGGRTSHAAVVARQMNKVCVVGCRNLTIDPSRHRCWIGQRLLHEGDPLSLDGHSGSVYPGKLDVVVETPTANLETVHRWHRHDATQTTEIYS